MPYTATAWSNNQVPALNATNLNKLKNELASQAAAKGISHSLPTWANGVAPAVSDPIPLNEMERVLDLVAAALSLSYSPTIWSSGWTPARNATNLNKMEAQAVANRAAIDNPPPPAGTLRWAINGSKWYDATHEPFRAQNLGAKTVRHEEDISSTASSLDARMTTYRNAGIEVLLQVALTGSVTTAQAQNCGAIATRHGPNGTGSMTHIEFGNETSYAYQTPIGSIPTVAQNYARRAKEAAISMQGTGVGLLVQADDALQGTGWVDNMFTAVPDLTNYVEGWTYHPYGPTAGTALGYSGGKPWTTDSRMDTLKNSLAAHGDTVKPIFFTEFGLATDNGNTLTQGGNAQFGNYGWKNNMTYAEAITAMNETVAMWTSKLGNRWVFTSYYRDFDTQGSGTGAREDYFGLVTSTGADKGSFTAAMRTRFAL